MHLFRTPTPSPLRGIRTRLWVTLTSIVLVGLCILPCDQSLAASANVGFRTIGWSDPLSGLRLDLAVWYPARRAARTLRYPPWKIEGAPSAPPAYAKHPVVLLSHPSSGTRFSFHDTAFALAEQGFIVAAPTHPGDNMDNMPHLCTWEQFDHRTKELPAVLGILLAQEDLREHADTSRVGVLGFGAGATTGLVLGGAVPDCADWEGYCEDAGTDIYCNGWARERITSRFCKALPTGSRLIDKRIKAVCAVSPDFGMLFSPRSFLRMRPSLMLVLTEREGRAVSGLAEHARKGLIAAPRVLELKNADLWALQAPCPSQLADELPEICRSVTDEDRQLLHRTLVSSISSFFRDTLGDPIPFDEIPSAPVPSGTAAGRGNDAGKDTAPRITQAPRYVEPELVGPPRPAHLPSRKRFPVLAPLRDEDKSFSSESLLLDKNERRPYFR